MTNWSLDRRNQEARAGIQTSRKSQMMNETNKQSELLLIQVIEDIKKIISRAPYRETVGEPTLTLMQIYATIEEAEKKIGK